MNSYPFMPLYWNDFLSDNKVRVMSSGELGAYVRLLGAAWHEDAPGTLSTDEATLARLAGVGAALWRKISPRVLACFVLNERAGRWEQKRMAQEYAALADRNDRRSESASKAAAARWGKGSQPNGNANAMRPHAHADANPDADALRTHCLSESNSDSPSHRELELAREPSSDVLVNEKVVPVAPCTSRKASAHETAGHPPGGPPGADAELLTETQALATAATAGVAPEFATMVHGDWFARGGRDGAGVAVPWSRYVAKRWAREGPQWKAGAHRCQTNSHSANTHSTHGNSDKTQRPHFRTEADRDRTRTGIDSSAGQALKRL
jgi:uncharacterized protein YdaU (DUF1376 family)